MKKVIAALFAIIPLTGCTAREVQLWVDWHAKDPTSADAYVDELRQSSRENNSHSIPVRTNNSSGTPGNCDSFASLFMANGLPVDTFKRIAWRESGCNPRSFVMNSTDSGGGLLGINLKGRLAATWYSWCGATLGNITNASINVKCAGVAYRKMGLQPWS